jgi:hypothetical protein
MESNKIIFFIKNLYTFFTTWAYTMYVLICYSISRYKVPRFIYSSIIGFLITASLVGTLIMNFYNVKLMEKYKISKTKLIFLDILFHILPLYHYIQFRKEQSQQLINDKNDYRNSILLCFSISALYLYNFNPLKIYPDINLFLAYVLPITLVNLILYYYYNG